MQSSPRLTRHQAIRITSSEEAHKAGAKSRPLMETEKPFSCVVGTEDLWVRVDYGPWVAVYRLVAQQGRLVIGELRIYPAEKNTRMGPGYWSGEYRGVRAIVPKGGLNSTLVDRLRPAGDVNVGRLILQHQRELANQGADQGPFWDVLHELGVTTQEVEPPATSHRMGGPAGKGIAYYRSVQKIYETALLKGEHPTKAVAKRLDLTSKQAAQVVYRTRNKYGLLPTTDRGVACMRAPADTTALGRVAARSKARVPKSSRPTQPPNPEVQSLKLP